MWLRMIRTPSEGIRWDFKKWWLMAIAAATAAVFVSDFLTPLGFVLWVAYIPLCVIAFWLWGGARVCPSGRTLFGSDHCRPVCFPARDFFQLGRR